MCHILLDTEQGNVSSVEDVSCVLSEKLSITDLECSLCCGYVLSLKYFLPELK